MYKLDGHLAEVTWDHIKPGHILRMGSVVMEVRPRESITEFQWISPAFSDNIIMHAAADDHGDLWVTLARPYAYVHLTGTTSPTVLTGVEEYKVLATTLVGHKSQFRVVLMSTGKPAFMSLDR